MTLKSHRFSQVKPLLPVKLFWIWQKRTYRIIEYFTGGVWVNTFCIAIVSLFGLVKQVLPCLLLNHLSWDIHIHNIYVQSVYLYMYVAHINREYFSIVKYYHNPMHTIFPILLYVRFTTYSRFAGYCLDIWFYNIQHLNFNHNTWYHIFGNTYQISFRFIR